MASPGQGLARSGQGPAHAAALHALAKVLPGANVAFFFGNLDCRLSEGLVPQLRDLEPAGRKAEIARVAEAYVAELATQAKLRDLNALVVSPAPKLIDLTGVGEADRALFEEVNLAFNQALGAAARSAGLAYVDLHERLKGPGGETREDVYFDRHRLRPHLFAEIFKGV